MGGVFFRPKYNENGELVSRSTGAEGADDLGVSFAFPTQTIHVAKPEDMEHPDPPKTDVEGTRRGRAVGADIARETLRPFRGDAPMPVGYDEEYFEEQVRGE